jgi:mannose-6-phosphate isomerase class I
MAVANLDVYVPTVPDRGNPEVIGHCKYFEAAKCNLEFTSRTFNVDKSSFLSITAIEGCGEIEGMEIKKGDTFFCPAGVGEISLSTEKNLSVITVRVP